MELQKKNVLVTGGSGFLGSSLVRELLKVGSSVVVLDNFFSGDIRNLHEIIDKVRLINGDITDDNLGDLLKENKIEYVFNLAAEPYIPHCYERPKKFFEVNAGGTLSMLLACKDANVKKIVQYSTSEVYGSAKYTPMDEDHPTLPLSTYAVSKLAADRLCYTFFHERGVPVIILRQFNTYGPRVTQPYIIPEFITQLSKGPKLKLGNVKARRDFTYVDDAAKASIKLMLCDDALGEAVNVGTGIDYSVEELANIVGKLMGHDKVDITLEKSRMRPLDVELLQCNSQKMQKLTGWKPTTSIEEGLKETIDSYKSNGGKWLWEEKVAPEEELWQKISTSKER